MSTQPTYFDLTDPETKQNWEREVHVEVAKRTALLNPDSGLIGDDPTFLCQRKKEVFADGGTQATITLVRQLRKKPTYGNQTLRDREEGIATATFKYQINQIRHAVAMNGRITKQRVTWDVWKQSITLMGEYWPRVMETAAMLHLAGVTTDVSTQAEQFMDATNLGCTFSNAPRAPDAAHIYRVNDDAGTLHDEDVANDASAVFDTNTTTRLVTLAKMLPIPIRPCMVQGQELYIFFVHPYQVRHLKENSRWLAKMRDTIKGGAIEGNPLFTGALGIDDGVLYVENPYLPPGQNSSTGARVADTRRGVFCGAQALTLGLGKEFDSQSTFQNDMESWDYANNKGVAATILAGFASPGYPVEEQNATAVTDFSKIVVTSYAKELYTSA